jgi:hypothetical protein
VSEGPACFCFCCSFDVPFLCLGRNGCLNCFLVLLCSPCGPSPLRCLSSAWWVLYCLSILSSRQCKSDPYNRVFGRVMSSKVTKSFKLSGIVLLSAVSFSSAAPTSDEPPPRASLFALVELPFPPKQLQTQCATVAHGYTRHESLTHVIIGHRGWTSSTTTSTPTGGASRSRRCRAPPSACAGC